MISKPLLKKEMKSNILLIIIFISVLTIYTGMIVYMYNPQMNEALDEMMNSMPEIFEMFGMSTSTGTLIEFTITYLYGFLLILFPSIFTILLANRLIVKYVDDGSMAYILSTPTTRLKVVLTQILFLIKSIFVLILYVTCLVIIMDLILFGGEIEILNFIYLNIGLFSLHYFFAGICFISSCTFSQTRKYTACAAGFITYSILVQMISQVGDKFEFLKYITPITLFDAEGLITKSPQAFLAVLILLILGTSLFIASAMIFNKKDLSL